MSLANVGVKVTHRQAVLGLLAEGQPTAVKEQCRIVPARVFVNDALIVRGVAVVIEILVLKLFFVFFDQFFGLVKIR